jgi:hypothetical protein
MGDLAKQFRFFVTMLSELTEIMYSISHAVEAAKSHREVRYKPLELVKETPGEALQKLLNEKEAN